MTVRVLIMSNFIAALTLFCIIHYIAALNSSYICTESYCEESRTQNPCEELPKECNITGKSIMMLEPSFCNCCDYCLVYLDEGDDCIYNAIGQTFHPYICGPGLTCDSETTKCIPITSKCMQQQLEFDESQKNGSWGFTQIRPLCDARGEFYPAHCIGSSICYCVNPDGERIFGEAVYTGPAIQQSMSCECSIANWKADKLAKEMGIHNQPVHCLQDGSYDPLQCNDKMCYCLNADTKTPDPNVYPVLEMNLLENNPECFDPEIHKPKKNIRECEEKLLAKLKEIELLKEEGITPVARLPNCQYDGYYGRVMITSTKKQCVDPDGKILDNYVVPLNDGLSEGMDCNCARTRWLLQQHGQTELPICCENGNFRKMQCRRGKCYCVDCNGNQLGVEMYENEKQKLDCKDSSTDCSICQHSPADTDVTSSFLPSAWDPSNDNNIQSIKEQ